MIRTEGQSFPGPDLRQGHFHRSATRMTLYLEHEMTNQRHIGILMLPTLLDVFEDGVYVGTAEHVDHTIENGLLEFELEREKCSDRSVASLDALSYMHQYVQFGEGRFEESNEQFECFLMQEEM